MLTSAAENHPKHGHPVQVASQTKLPKHNFKKYQQKDLVGGFNPSTKILDSQIGNLPQIGVQNKTYLKSPRRVALQL